MSNHDGMYMMEADARRRIKSIINKLREAYKIGTETKAEDDSSSVEFHIRRIIESGGGAWNEAFAKDYIENLEANIAASTRTYQHVM